MSNRVASNPLKTLELVNTDWDCPLLNEINELDKGKKRTKRLELDKTKIATGRSFTGCSARNPGGKR